jgi:hypothetical protein
MSSISTIAFAKSEKLPHPGTINRDGLFVCRPGAPVFAVRRLIVMPGNFVLWFACTSTYI